MEEQARDAAERSTPIPPRGAEVTGPPADTRPGYWVELLDANGAVCRRWFTRLEQPPVGYALRVRPENPR